MSPELESAPKEALKGLRLRRMVVTPAIRLFNVLEHGRRFIQGTGQNM